MKASLFFKDRAGSLAGLFFVLVLEALFMRVLLVSGPVIGGSDRDDCLLFCGGSVDPVFQKEEDIITG